MDCREFRDKHVAFVDDLLPEVDMRAMYEHRDVCDRCGRKDTAVRRGLLLIRSLPRVEPSRDFMARLEARLREPHPAPVLPVSPVTPMRAALAVAAGLALVGYLAMDSARRTAPSEFEMQPVVASTPELPSAFANPAFVVSVPTGMGLWPAVYLAAQPPVRFAGMDFGPE
jgi:hypothetical protein